MTHADVTQEEEKEQPGDYEMILRNYLLFFLIINVCLTVQAHFNSIKKKKTVIHFTIQDMPPALTLDIFNIFFSALGLEAFFLVS